jgi:hypothetical protein
MSLVSILNVGLGDARMIEAASTDNPNPCVTRREGASCRPHRGVLEACLWVNAGNVLCLESRTWYVRGEGVSVPDRVPGWTPWHWHSLAHACSHLFSRLSELEVLRAYALHEREQGKMTCHVGSWPMDHGEAEVMPKCGEGEMNLRGNGTPPGPSLTAAAEPNGPGV